MTRPITLPAPAKLNLFLHITGQRDDGYHELQTVFQLINFCDELTFSPSDSNEICLTGDTSRIKKSDNLIWRAAKLLQEESGCNNGIDIKLRKRIPMGGGLGGGSSDAATTLLALNKLWKTGFTIEELMPLGLKLGADVPVFIGGSSVWAEGIGEQLSAITLPEEWYLVVTPDCHVDTAKVFRHKQLTRDTNTIRIRAFLAGGTVNNCEKVVRKLHPKVNQAFEALAEIGSTPRMTGTGACVFSTFNNRQDANQALDAIKPFGMKAFIAKGMQHSPLHERLGLRPLFS
ncbi:MAG: 4-(cytidine 5'-diphospho)-2-C-methyl-D-erythritol kinase [Pseudomonadales bacterium]|nr:4-(cytidine 5'-diphospho)-2-C-methyl-D-erythritol kinase [Pseudomonadales bacterium]